MNTITYHKATIQDVNILVENRILFALELSGIQDEMQIQSIKIQLTEYFTKAIENNTCISFIASSDDLTVGIGSVYKKELPGNFKNPSGKWGYIMNMYTIPSYRRKGICKTILELLVSEGKKQGITAFELHATKDGEQVYKHNGFDIYNEPTYRKYIN